MCRAVPAPGDATVSDGKSASRRDPAGAQVVSRVSERPDGSERPFGQAFSPLISADGRRVAFSRTLLVPDKSNLCWAVTFGAPRRVACLDLFVLDIASRTVARIFGPEGVEISADSSGVMSADGRWIVIARELRTEPVPAGPRQLLLQDRTTGVTTVIGSSLDRAPSISADGRRVAFVRTTVTGSVTTNNVLVYDRVSGATERADVDLPGATAVSLNARLSGDGSVVAFEASGPGCPAGPISRIFIRDLEWKRTSEPMREAHPCGDFELSGISREGRFVLFESGTPNLVADDPAFGDVFVVDRLTGISARASRGAAQRDGVSFGASVSSDGLRVVFTSQALNLLPVRAQWANHVYLASLDLDGDGMADAWERYFGLSPADRADAAADADGDGVVTGDEYRLGMHPRGPFRLRTTGAVVNPDTSRVLLGNFGSRDAVLWLRAVDAQGRWFASPVTLGPRQTTIFPVIGLMNRPPGHFTLHIESDQLVRTGLSR